MKPLEEIGIGVLADAQPDRAVPGIDFYDFDIAGVEVGSDFHFWILDFGFWKGMMLLKSA